MKKTIAWTLAIALGLILLFILPSLFMLGHGWTGYGRMGGYSMMGSRFGFMPFGWIGMLLGWLIPLGLLVLAVLGIISLFNRNKGTTPSAPPARTCAQCSKPAQADWKTCPYCGNSLA
ncbi:MAG: hypothetical protein KJ606_14200 [Chloroflexi bacterium]|nr:hypothetical protein [Chloroflexota bacterium]